MHTKATTALLWILTFVFCCSAKLHAQSTLGEQKVYKLSQEAIDVVIPYSGNDAKTLELCIEGVRKNCKQIRRIIVVSGQNYTESAEWFDEKKYPFSKLDLIQCIFADAEKAQNYVNAPYSKAGWIFQQLLKLYAPFVIPNISSNVLVVDSDTIFLHPVEFLTEDGGGYLTCGTEYYPPYFAHMQRVLPGFEKVRSSCSGVAHHMLFQRQIVDALLNCIEKHHNVVAWRAICRCIDQSEVYKSCMSEYEMYFNFALAKTNQVKVRELKWAQIGYLHFVPEYAAQGYTYVSCHEYPEQTYPFSLTKEK